MPNYEFRLQVKFKCDSKSKLDVGGAPSGGSEPSKMDVMFVRFGVFEVQNAYVNTFDVFLAIYKEKRSGNVTTRRAIPRSYRNVCFKHAFL